MDENAMHRKGTDTADYQRSITETFITFFQRTTAHGLPNLFYAQGK